MSRCVNAEVLVRCGRLPRHHGLAAARLPTPFGGDQALNLLIGQVIHDGGSPYRELWDLKRLGIFVFFATGGALFRFNETGIHTVRDAVDADSRMLVRVAAVRWLESRTSASLAPALTVGLYYGVANERYLTQTEALVGLPLLASLWSPMSRRCVHQDDAENSG